MINQIYVNLPVKNLKKSMAFFKGLGFSFNPKFTDNKAACMIIGKNMYSMLIAEKYFKTFTKKEISNAKKTTEVLISLQMKNKAEVDTIMARALKLGGKRYRDPFDYGWMYGDAFADLDGHQWEIFYMNEKKMPKKLS